MRILIVLNLDDSEDQYDVEDFSSVTLEHGFLRITQFNNDTGKLSKIYRNTALIDSFWIK